MPFVLDASIAASWGLADEESVLALKAEELLKRDVAIVTRIWWYEIRNILLVNERRQRIAASDSATFLRLLSAYPIQIDSTFDGDPVMELARRHRLSFYDAAYLEVAKRHAIPLVSLDKALNDAANAENLPALV